MADVMTQIPDWLTQFMQANNLTLDKTGNFVPAPQSKGVSSGPVALTSAMDESAPQIDPSRLWGANTNYGYNNAPIIPVSSLYWRNDPALESESGNPIGGYTGWQVQGAHPGGQGENYVLGGTQDAPTLQIKAPGAYQGVRYDYTKDPTGQYWMPSQQGTPIQMGGAAFGSDVWGPALLLAGGYLGGSALAGAGGGADAAAAGAGGGAMDTAGFEGLAAADVGLGGGTAGGTAGAGMGTTGGFLDSAGAAEGIPMGTSTANTTAGSGLFSGSGAGNSSLLGQVSNAIQSGDWSSLASNIASNPRVWGALGQTILGYLGNRSLTGNAANQAQQQADANFQYAGALRDMAGQVKDQTTFKPIGYTNASGSTTYDAATGTWKSTLSPQAQDQYNMWNNLGADALQRYKGLDPNAIASQRYADVQKLLAPGRQATMDSLLGRLKASGQMGLGVTDVNGSTNNPLLSSLASANAQQDLTLGMQAQDYGQQAQTAALGQVAGIFGQQQPLVSNANATFQPAFQGTGQQLTNNQATAALWSQLMGQAAGRQFAGASPNSTLFGYQQGQTAGNYGMWADILKGLVGGMGGSGGQ